MSVLGNNRKMFGPYTMVRRLAVGGMSEIWLAEQKGISGFLKQVVIKTILDYLADDPELVEMFLDEGRIAARLGHPNIAQIYDLGKIDETYYLVMEYIQGRDLRYLMAANIGEEKLVPLNIILRIAAEVSAGLHHAHSYRTPEGKLAGIVHRDISPDNIICTFEGTVKIVDFGIAKASHQAKTKTGILKGKYAYMSPEQVRGKQLDLRSDIFSLGVVMYELISGRRLFKRESEVSTLEAVNAAEVPSIREFEATVPNEVEEIVLQALKKNPDERFASARDMQLAIERAMINLQLVSSSADLSSFMHRLFDEEDEMDKQMLSELKDNMERLPDVTESHPRVDKTTPLKLRPESSRPSGSKPRIESKASSQPRIRPGSAPKSFKPQPDHSEDKTVEISALRRDETAEQLESAPWNKELSGEGSKRTKRPITHPKIDRRELTTEDPADFIRPTSKGSSLQVLLSSAKRSPLFLFFIAFGAAGLFGFLLVAIFGGGSTGPENGNQISAQNNLFSNTIEQMLAELDKQNSVPIENPNTEISTPDKPDTNPPQEPDKNTNVIQPGKKKRVASKPSEDKGYGFVDVGFKVSGKWAAVYVDDKPIVKDGKLKYTPISGHKISAGKHVIELRDQGGASIHRWRIAIRKNQHVRLLF